VSHTLSALRAERERQGLILSEVSERSGIDRATISRLETGKVPNPAVGTLRALSRALNKRLSWSLTDEPASVGRWSTKNPRCPAGGLGNGGTTKGVSIDQSGLE